MIVAMYRKMYTALFNAVTDALRDMDDANYLKASERLKRAQMETEELFVLWEETFGLKT